MSKQIPVILHTPHASAVVPEDARFSSSAWLADIAHMTDWRTNDMVTGYPRYQSARSRVWCDMERFPDANEPLVQEGHGFYRTHNLKGFPYRELHQKLEVLAAFDNYHLTFERGIRTVLEFAPAVLIVDTHSFEDDEALQLPDICIGSDNYHTPPWLVDIAQQTLRESGKTVAVNKPYVGSFVPYPLYQKEPRVHSLMLEVNKRVYMKPLPSDIEQRSLSEIVRACLGSVMEDRFAVLSGLLTRVVTRLDRALNGGTKPSSAVPYNSCELDK